MKRILIAILWASPAFGQYAGPAILSRGDAPSSMSGAQVNFRPFVEVLGIYDTGLAGVAVNPNGDLGNAASEGVELGWGVSGTHSWRHTEIGLDYHGDIRHYSAATYYDSTDQALLLGIKHQFTRHISVSLRNSAGMFSYGGSFSGLPQTVRFDPSQSFIPVTDFFDNRTIYASSMADMVIQKSSRLSFSFGGGGFLNRRRSTALYGVVGAVANADVQYRLTRRTTIGAEYSYNHYSFNRIFSSTDTNGGAATYAVQLSRRWEFTGFGGATRVETKFIQNVPLDPAIAAILGVSSGLRVIYSIRTIPVLSARLSRTFSRGVFYLNGGHTVTPGNGLFLTTSATSAGGGYTYTGLRRWSFNASVGYDNNKSIGNIIGKYTDTIGTVTASRQITRSFHAIASFSGREYGSGDFAKYNRVIYSASLGVGFAPGDVPIRIW